MKRSHYIWPKHDSPLTTELVRIGAAVPDRFGVRPFQMPEDSPLWTAVAALIERYRGGDRHMHFAFVEFDAADRERAEWLKIDAWSHGYPQPESDFRFREVTYDVSAYCAECGIGGVQRAPFRMKGEPKWGTRDLMHLEWVHDEVFARKDFWLEKLEPLGIQSRVVHNRRGEPLESVVQVVVDEEMPVDVSGLPSTTCSKCGRTKYSPQCRDGIPPLIGTPSSPIIKSSHWFGAGHSAFKHILISRVLYRSIRGSKAVAFRPAIRAPILSRDELFEGWDE